MVRLRVRGSALPRRQREQLLVRVRARARARARVRIRVRVRAGLGLRLGLGLGLGLGQLEQLLVEGLLHVAAAVMERLQAGEVGDGAQRAGAVGGVMERLPKRRLVVPQDLGLGLGLG